MVHFDADFSGNWDNAAPENDRDTDRSRHGHAISCMGALILWKSQLQTEIALSRTESEYTDLSYALRDAILIMNILQEMKSHGIAVNNDKPVVTCKVF